MGIKALVKNHLQQPETIFLSQIIWKLRSKSSKSLTQSYISYAIRMSFACYLCAFIFYLYVLIYHSYASHMYSHVIRMSLICTRMSLVCTRMSSVCHSYVPVCYPHATRMYSYVIRMYLHVIRMSLVCGFTMNSKILINMLKLHKKHLYCRLGFKIKSA